MQAAIRVLVAAVLINGFNLFYFDVAFADITKVWTIHVMDGGLSPLLVIPQSTQKSFSLDLTAYRSKALHQNWRLPSYWLKPCRGTGWKPTKE